MGMALESLIPFAAGHELIRQHRHELELIGPISDMLFDQLIDVLWRLQHTEQRFNALDIPAVPDALQRR